MKKVILEEIENMKYLLGYKRGVVISEQQQTTYGNEYITGANPSVNPAQIPSLGTIQPSNQSPADMLKNAQATAAGLTTTNNQSPQDIANELERQQGAAYKGFKDFQAKYQPQTPSPAAATGAPPTGAPPTGAPPTGAPTTAAPTTPIKTGVKYPSIVELQNSLNTKNQAGLTPDGKYGPKTSASILAALQKLPVNSTETKTLGTNNTDQSAETLKKTAEANASTNGVVNNDQNKNTQSNPVNSNVPEGDINEYI